MGMLDGELCGVATSARPYLPEDQREQLHSPFQDSVVLLSSLLYMTYITELGIMVTIENHLAFQFYREAYFRKSLLLFEVSRLRDLAIRIGYT